MLNLASGAPEDAKVRDVFCMIVMLYEVYFKSVDDACGTLDGSFCRRKTISKRLAAEGAVGQHCHRAATAFCLRRLGVFHKQ